MAADGMIGDPYLEFLYPRTATLLVPIAGMYELFGPSELFGQLYVALLGAATAALTARLAMETIGAARGARRRPAALAGPVVLLILKDAALWALLSALALIVALVSIP